MKYNFAQLYKSHESIRLSGVVFVIAALFFSTFCLTANTASAHGGHIEESAEVMHLNDPINQDCCHGLFHNKNHESVKITIGGQQTTKQIVIADTSNFPNLVISDIGNINDFDYLKNLREGESPPSPILRC